MSDATSALRAELADAVAPILDGAVAGNPRAVSAIRDLTISAFTGGVVDSDDVERINAILSRLGHPKSPPPLVPPCPLCGRGFHLGTSCKSGL